MASTTTKCPFDVIVITSPDNQAATAAQELIISSCGDFSSSSSKTLADQNQNQKDDSAPVVLQSNTGTLYISSCDPYGARMGSGGGTIAALAEADYAYQQQHTAMKNKNEDSVQPIIKSDYPTVLICHAGGESSRCPTQIVLGKAWTSLPVLEEQQTTANINDGSSSSSTLKNDGHSSTSTSVSNPTALLISSLSTIFEDIPKGSVVVAASDVLLSFDAESSSSNSNHNQKINFDTIAKEDNSHYNHVLGLAVPAPLSTAKNHGVFVLDSSSSNEEDKEEEWRIRKTYKVLQKPSISEMNSMSNPACTFSKDETKTQNVRESNAWIDTGVCTFLPHAAKTLRDLSKSTLNCCTRLGLQEMYKEEQRQTNDYSGRVSLEQFAKSETQKICLYGDMLHALQTETNEATKTHEGEFTTILDELSNKLSQHELYTCAVPAGSFVHLGTTKELADFLTMGATSSTCGGKVDDNDRLDNMKEMQRYQHFGKALGLTRRADSFVSGFASNDNVNDGNIVVNSVLVSKSEQSSSLGRLSVIEHCHIECEGNIEIGEQAIVSGVRGSIKGDSFRVPDGICLQLLPLCQQNGGGESFVCICTGVEDAIKYTPVKLYGVSLHLICEQYGISEDDLWDESIPSSKRMLWNAKIHPVLTADGDGKIDYSFLDWITLVITGGKSVELDSSDTSPAMLGLKQWKEAKRLSLSQIRQCVDSEAEARYRSSISSKKYEDARLAEVSEILLNRRHEPCNFDYVIDSVLSSNSTGELRNVLHTLCNVASDALTNGQFDIVGRSFSTMALLIDDSFQDEDLANGSSPEIDVDNSTLLMEKAIDGLMSSKIPQDTVSFINLICNASIDGSYELRTVVTFLENAAAITTERCLSGDALSSTYEQTSPLPIGVFAMAGAPARIDLAGGWSDTPPISFENGGSVACLAVLVDGKRPLKATCRTVEGGTGIKLRTESRSLDDESLVLSSSEVTVYALGDLADYNDPMAKCALLKCVLIQLGLVPLDLIRADDNSTSIQPFLQKFCQQTDDVGLDIVSQSLLPTGSGMGSSSILAGCILAAVAKCVGIQLTGCGDTTTPFNQVQINDSSSLIHAVLMVEQLLTTGGGWQDNIGGLVGGLKLGSSDAHVLPLQTKVKYFDLSPELIDELNQRLCLVFSGKPRLAKNILSNVLRRWARRSEEIMGTVDGLVKGATEAIESIQAGNFDRLGSVMSQYWQYKIAMAGKDSGVEPPSVHSVLKLLSSSGDIVGGTLCGAGGGGFLVMLASKGRTPEDIEATVTKSMSNGNNTGFDSFSWHTCSVSKDGMVVNVVHAQG